MSKRGDNIHKRKDGRWEGRIKVGSYPNGKTKYRSLYGASYKEVKEKMVSFGDGSISIKPPGSGKTLEELLIFLGDRRITIIRESHISANKHIILNIVINKAMLT